MKLINKEKLHIMAHLRYLQARGLPRGYYPEPTKIILVMVPRNVARVEELFRGMGIQVVTGHQYLGGFIGGSKADKRWLAGKVTGWAASVKTLAGVSRNHRHSTYAGLRKSLQQEWALVQWVALGIGDAFGLLEKALWEIFAPALFEVLGEGSPERGFSCLPVKQAGLALSDPTQTAPKNLTAGVITGHLVPALRGQVEFQTLDHSACLREGCTAVW